MVKIFSNPTDEHLEQLFALNPEYIKGFVFEGGQMIVTNGDQDDILKCLKVLGVSLMLEEYFVVGKSDVRPAIWVFDFERMFCKLTPDNVTQFAKIVNHFNGNKVNELTMIEEK